MKRPISVAGCVFVSILLIASVNAWSKAGPKTQKEENQAQKSQQAGQNGENTPSKSNQSPVLKTQKDRVNYAIGVQTVGNFKQQGVEIDLDLVMKGMKDAYSGKKLLMTEGELRKAIMVYMSEVRQKQVTARAKVAEANEKEGTAFLAENKNKDGVVTLPIGLQYKIIKAGDGAKPTDTDTVECQFKGTLINGTEFDSSFRTGRPAIFKVSGVIPGWREALKLMPVGSKWQLFIPPQLAYGDRGGNPPIGPNTTLVFEVDLLAIK